MQQKPPSYPDHPGFCFTKCFLLCFFFGNTSGLSSSFRHPGEVATSADRMNFGRLTALINKSSGLLRIIVWDCHNCEILGNWMHIARCHQRNHVAHRTEQHLLADAPTALAQSKKTYRKETSPFWRVSTKCVYPISSLSFLCAIYHHLSLYHPLHFNIIAMKVSHLQFQRTRVTMSMR